MDEDCPIDRLLCFAPANFGSDLAGLGQSFLGKFRTTFFNSNSHKEDFLESGKVVLRGLEPASPFQWDLSFNYDLHGDASYFSEKRKESQRCYPFVFAAGEAYGGVEAKLVKQRAAAWNGWHRSHCRHLAQHARLFTGFPNGWRQAPVVAEQQVRTHPVRRVLRLQSRQHRESGNAGFMDANGPGTIALVRSEEEDDHARRICCDGEHVRQSLRDATTRACRTSGRRKYQQFFFRVRDDVDQLVEDYFIDFYVLGKDSKPHQALTLKFDEDFESHITTHSTTGRIAWS